MAAVSGNSPEVLERWAMGMVVAEAAASRRLEVRRDMHETICAEI